MDLIPQRLEYSSMDTGNHQPALAQPLGELDSSPPLDPPDATQPEATRPETSWPTRLYVWAWLFGLLTTLATGKLDGVAMGVGRTRAKLGIFMVLLLRLMWARYRCEQSKLWIAYVIPMFGAVIFYEIAESWVLYYARGY